jgi:hypothetical protein
LPSAPSSEHIRSSRTNSRAERKDTWPTAGTMLFSGVDLEEAVAAAVEELGADIDVRAARSVKQGLRGRTHVEVLVANAAPRGTDFRPPLPPSELFPPEQAGFEHPAHDHDPVETTLAALLASAEAEEQAFQLTSSPDHPTQPPSTVATFDPPQLPGNPTFAAEFAAAFPAALAAVKAAEATEVPVPVPVPAPARRPARTAKRAAVVPARATIPVPGDDFTARVREALRRVPEEVEEPVAAAPPPAPAVPAAPPAAAHPHPALDLLDNPTEPLPATVAGPAVRPRPTPSADAGRRSRPSPGPLAAADRPTALRSTRPATAAWSRERLRSLGVPDAVLEAMPTAEPTEDLRWLVALTDAIAGVIPGPAENGCVDVTASGTGLRGALALLRLGVSGISPQTLTIDDRAVPATATELALAIRAGVLR